MPIRKDDEVQVVRGKLKSEGTTKVTSVYRKRYCLHLEGQRFAKEKATGATSTIPVHSSNVVITKLKLSNDRKNLIERKKAGRGADKDKGKGKFSEKDVSMSSVD